jgi:peptidoglycan-associated lipoprotein
MKKMVLLLILPLFLALVFSACCCPKKKAAREMPTTEVAPVTEVQETPPPPEPVAKATLEPIYFDFDKSNLKNDTTATLDKNAEWLSKNSTAKIRIEGNCDERGTIEYNVALGERRANSAKQYLIKLGVGADRLSTISYGKEKPLDPGHNEAAWTKNRRDDFRVVE